MLLVVDTSIWVAAFVPTDRLHAEASRFVDRVLKGELEVLLPDVILTEIVCALARRLPDGMPLDQQDAARDFAVRWGEHMLGHPHVRWRPVDQKFAYGAAYWGRLCGLTGMDALVGFAALDTECDLLSEDSDHYDRMNKRLEFYKHHAEELRKTLKGDETLEQKLRKLEDYAAFANFPAKATRISVRRLIQM